MRKFALLILASVALFLSACAQDAVRGEDAVTVGEVQERITFDDPTAFETGGYDDAGAALTISDGGYVLTQRSQRSQYIWGQGGAVYTDVAVEAVAQSQSNHENNLYGVMCRVTEDGAGYAFLVGNDGFGGIARTDGRSLTMLFDWVQHEAINTGQAENTIRGVCTENYLALYVNGEFIGDIEDDLNNRRYVAEGQLGVLGGVFVESGDDLAEIEVRFDDLTAYEAELR